MAAPQIGAAFMIERTLRYPEYLGLIGALYDLCDLIAEVYAAPFSRMVDRNTAARIGQLRMINGVLNPDLTLCPNFRNCSPRRSG